MEYRDFKLHGRPLDWRSCHKSERGLLETRHEAVFDDANSLMP